MDIGLGKILGIVGVILMIVFTLVAFRNFISDSNTQLTAEVIKDVEAVKLNGNEQVVELTLKNFNYFPNVLNLKVGKPVKIIVDTNKIGGCFSTILIPDFGIKKFIRRGDNVIEFTPTKTGTFKFYCPMGMGSGKIIVS